MIRTVRAIAALAAAASIAGCGGAGTDSPGSSPPGGVKSPLSELPSTLMPADAERTCAEVLGSAKDVGAYLGFTSLKEPAWSHGMGGTSFWQNGDTPGDGEAHTPGFRCDLKDGDKKVLLAMVVSPPDGGGFYSATSKDGQVEAYIRDVMGDGSNDTLFDGTDAKKRAVISKWLQQAANAAS